MRFCSRQSCELVLRFEKDVGQMYAILISSLGQTGGYTKSLMESAEMGHGKNANISWTVLEERN